MTHTQRAAALDAADPLAPYREEFLLDAAPAVTSYLDGNSLGRPLTATPAALDTFLHQEWGGRLIQGWTEGPHGGWMDWPTQLGDQIGRVALGAAAGQTVVADSTTVLFYKLVRAAAAAGQAEGRDEIVCDTDNFPTDRFVLEGIAAETGLTLRWIETDPASGITPDQVRAAVGPRTALATFSHVAYRSGHLADAAAITRVVHDAGALVLFDLSHSAGSVELELDAWGVDLAVGCCYKYLNGGPGAPAFAYLATRHQGSHPQALRQPVQGWMGHADPFAMGQGYQPDPGIRQLISGTPPIVAMVPVRVGLDQLERAGIAAVRAKSTALTTFALDLADDLLAPHGVTVATPREPEARGGHITLRRSDFRDVTAELWTRGVVPDFRTPDGIRLGLAPLSTSFTEVLHGVLALQEIVEATR
ncbi:aminotransferase class V-fold PLP-dependent enzyme [Kineococcus sp. NBC_00420]|uniref:kynureninase n=1 Tax=Kineococcus sp. NBC_00420 TaxID=2903564 RepID=UPI002E1B7843